jgi:hypothetical protein
MATVHLRIEPDLCGPVSVGTVRVIRLLCDCLALSLSDAVGYVNRAVFDGETVSIATPSAEAAERFLRDARALRTPAKLHVRLASE